MAATVQPDPLDVLMRRIGYAVHLEDTFNRVRDLVEIYEENSEVSIGAWNSLVEERWGLKTRHIEDVLRAFNLLDVQKGTIHVLPGLDEMALAKRQTGEEGYDDAHRFLFAKQVLLADGDIFLNCLSGEFENDRIARNLKEMIVFKRTTLLGVFRSRDVLQKIFRIVSIDVQGGNVGGAGVGATLSGRSRRGPLGIRTTPLNATPSVEPEDLSEDYFRKVPPKRKGWGYSIGLCDERGRLTEDGAQFLDVLRAHRFGTDDQAFALWPLDYELAQMRIKATSMDVPILDPWEFLLLVREAMGGGTGVERVADDTVKTGLDLLASLYGDYRALSPRRQMLRQELPLQVVYSVVVAIAYASHGSVLPIPAIIQQEAHQPKSRIRYRPSRSMGGALVVRK